MYIRPDSEALRQQQLPRGTGVDVAHLVQQDIEDRINMGALKYGERLTTHNGRDALIDLYQEILDAAVYLRQYIEEQKDGKPNNTGEEK